MICVTAHSSLHSPYLSLLPLFWELSSQSNLFGCVDYKTLHGVRSGMATYRLTPPAPFPFKSPAEWLKWKKHFEQFHTASGLAAEQDRKQVNTLLYTMGEEAEDTLESTNPTADERNTYWGVIGKFVAFFQVRRNVIFERARFNRCQNEDESVEQFITSLYSHAERCDYGALREAMI